MTEIPRDLGPLRVFSRIGQGGMGAVYAGFDLEAKDFVAIKTLFQELEDDEVAVSLFDHECTLSGYLEHPNVVRFFRTGDRSRMRYLALEYVRGATISDILARRERMPPAEVVEVLEDTASALRHVHEKNIVHRDVKPENLIINQDGVLKLIDFGIGTYQDEDPLGDEGMVVGTCTYAAPEQNQGQDVGPQADLYALGAVAWHALVGRRWAQGQTPFEIGLAQMATTPEAPSSQIPGIPPRLDSIVLRLMERDPMDRYRSAASVLDELRSFREEEEQKSQTDNIFADPLAGKWSVAKRSFYEKRYALSKSLARYIADRRPDFAPVHFLLGKLFALETREFNSTDSFRRALELDPDNLEYQADFALSLYRLNMFSLAEQELSTLSARAPGHPLARGFHELVTEKLEEERAADARRHQEEAGPSLAELKEADLHGVDSHEDRPVEAAELAPEDIEEQPPAAPPEDVRSASGWFPGLGRLQMGDHVGAVTSALPALVMVGVLVACWMYPQAPTEGWDEFLGDFVLENITDEAKAIEGWVPVLYGGIQVIRAGVALITAAVLFWYWRREIHSSHRDARIQAYRGQVLAILADGQLRANLGSVRGAYKGLVLQVYRRVGARRREFVLGALRLEIIGLHESAGTFRPEVGVTDAPIPGDRVRISPKLLRDERDRRS